STSRATAWPARCITASSFTPDAQVTFSHSRICATVMTGTGMQERLVGSASEERNFGSELIPLAQPDLDAQVLPHPALEVAEIGEGAVGVAVMVRVNHPRPKGAHGAGRMMDRHGEGLI